MQKIQFLLLGILVAFALIYIGAMAIRKMR